MPNLETGFWKLKHLLRRFSIYGDFWLRFLYYGARHCPWFLEPLYVFGFTIIFWVVLGKARRAMARNLGVLLPGSSLLMNQLRVFRIFWNFAFSLGDVCHVRHGRQCIRWEVCGAEHLDELETRQPGAVLLTAHMGNYDVAAPLLAQRIHRTVHLVRTPERESKSQEFEKGKRDDRVGGNCVIHYNEPGNMLGVTLAQAIAGGGIVAVQGDRILFDVSPVTVPYNDEGVEWKVPRGPFMLAVVAKAAIHPVFIIRMGWRRYRVLAEPVIEVPPHDRDRERVAREAAMRWSAVLRRVAERHWRQWFVFEELFTRAEPSPAAGVGEEAPHGNVDEPTKIDSVIPAKTSRGVKATFFWNLVAGGWTSAVVLRRLLEWAVGDWLHVAGVLLLWPVLWFLMMVVIAEAALGVTYLVSSLRSLSLKTCDVLTCAGVLVIFSAMAWAEMRSGCHVGWWVGVIGFAGLAIGLVTEGVPLLLARQEEA